MRVGRNELCPCGSGKKSKNCHAGRSERGISKGLIALIVAIAAIAAIGLFPRDGKQTAVAAANSAPAARPGSPQPGPAPAGKVWSQEHGHWHDAPRQIPITMTPPGGTAAPAVAGQPGQPAQAPTPAAPVPQPDGPVPPGKVWSPEHGHWHDQPKQQ